MGESSTSYGTGREDKTVRKPEPRRCHRLPCLEVKVSVPSDTDEGQEGRPGCECVTQCVSLGRSECMCICVVGVCDCVSVCVIVNVCMCSCMSV